MNQNLLARIAPIAVIGAALTFSAWSLYYVARSWGTPIIGAIIVSTIFDGAAVWLANIALESIIEGDSALGTRLLVFTCAGASAWLNIQHSYIGHYPASSRVLWGAPPIIAVIVYDRYAKRQRRKTLRNIGAIPPAMPRFSGWNWLLFPGKTLGHVRAIAKYRGNLARFNATGELLPGTLTVTGANPVLTPELLAGTTANPADVRRWARLRGLPVGRTGPIPAEVTASYMRAMLSGELSQSESESPESFEEFETGITTSMNGHKPNQSEEF